jgi:hypothetical protein
MFCYFSKTFNILLNFFLRERYYVTCTGGMKSLKSIGNLYKNDGDFSNREVSNEDITQMSKFLEREKKKLLLNLRLSMKNLRLNMQRKWRN